MIKLARAVLAALALFAAPALAIAQSFPQTLPARTVYGRLGTTAGPGQAIPFATLFANLSSGNNTFTGDAYFQSGRPWCDVRAAAYGAKGDGVTSDLTAFQGCVTALTAFGGGMLFVPPGVYCVPGFSVTGATIQVVGAAREAVVLSACGSDAATVTLNSSQSGLWHITVRGYNALTPSSTSSAVVLGTSCGACTVEDAHIQEGYFGLDIGGFDVVIDNVSVDSTYGLALARTTNGAVYFRRVALDQTWQGNVLAPGSSVSAWTGTHAYTTGTVVSITQGGKSYYIQAQSNGTSASSQPTVLPYGAGNFTDGSVTWHILAPATFYGLLIDSGSFVIYNEQGDFTGPFTASIAIQNNAATTAPGSIHLTDATAGEYFDSGILASAGHDLDVKGGTMGTCVLSGCNGIKLSDSWSGDVTIENVSIIGNFNGINVSAGKNTSIIGNRIFSGGGYTNPIGVNIAANINSVHVIGNALGSSNVSGSLQTGVNLAAGTSDFIEIAGNNCNGVVGSCVAGETGISNATGYTERNASIVLGGATNGAQGTGTINVKTGYYLNGSLQAQRTKLTGTTDYYVNGNSGSTAACGPTGSLTCSAGSDSNNCLTPATACLTAQHVVNIIIGSVDLNQNLAQINLAHHTGTTNYSFQCEQGPIIGNAGFAVLGDSSSPTAVNITAPNSGNAITTRDLCIVTLKNVRILDQGSAVAALDITQFSIMDLTGVHFGAFNSSGDHIIVEGGHAKATLIGSNSIDGGAGAFLVMRGGAIVDFNNATVAIPSAVSFATATYFASGPSNVLGLSTGTFTGSGVAGTTGVRAIMANAAFMQAGGGACASVWPGNAACQFTNMAYDDAGDATTGGFSTIKIAGTTISATSGSGSTLALTTSPVFTTPTLGTATGTKLTLANGTSGGIVLNNAGGTADASLSEGAGGGLLFTMGTVNTYQVRDNNGNPVSLTSGTSGSSATGFQDGIVIGTTTITTTPATGELMMTKRTASTTAPSAGFCKEEWVAGTNGGTCKKIAFCGTSNTAVTIIDNVGAGC